MPTSQLLSQSPAANQLLIIGMLMPTIIHKQNNLFGPLIGYCEFALEALPAGHPARADIIKAQNVAREAAAYAAAVMTIYRQLEDAQRAAEQQIRTQSYADEQLQPA
jgi:hypothetical protein